MKLIGRKIEMILDGNLKILGYVVAESTSLITIKDDKTSELINIPFHKWGVFKIIDAPKLETYIYMCKNDCIKCKGVKFLSSKKDETLDKVECGAKKTNFGDFDCDFGLVGNFFELPMEIQMAFLEGMSTRTPIQINKEVKDGKK